MKTEETSDNFIHLKVRTFIGVVGGLLVGTNIVNSVLHDISENYTMIEYNAKAEDRRRAHLEEKLDYKMQLSELKEELKDCKDGNK